MSRPSLLKFLKRLVLEAHRRSLWQVLAIYGAASWLVFEVVQTLTEGLGLPRWFPAFAFVLLLIGLPIVLATAFVQEGGPRGDEVDGFPELGDLGLPDEAGDEIGLGGVRAVFTWRNALAGGVLAFALWGVVAAGWLVAGGNGLTPDRASGSGNVIAVLPFASLSPDEENAYFADGIHEDILTHLSKLQDLTVLARTSVLRYRDTEMSIGEIATELDADAILEGSVRREGGEVRVVAQLIDPGTGGHLWSDTYDRRLDDIFALQTEIAQRVARELEATLSPEEEERIEKRPTESLAAYDLYLKGREAYQRYEDRENDEAIRLFRSALELDPEYALAWAGLGDAFGQRVDRFGYSRAWADSAVRVARRAVELDPQLAEGYKALGLGYIGQGRLREALEANLRTVELDPNHHGAVNNIGTLYADLGEFDEAISWYRRSVRLAPNIPIATNNIAYAYTFLEMDEPAREWIEVALTIDPDNVTARLGQAVHALTRGDAATSLSRGEDVVQSAPAHAFAWTGAAGVAYMARDFERAVTYARRSLDLAPDNTLFYWHITRTLLGLSVVASGADEEGRALLESVTADLERRIERGDEDPILRWDLATIHATLGEGDAALEWLERAYGAGFRYVRWPKRDPAFDGLREQPRFRTLQERLEADAARMRQNLSSRPPGD